MMTVLSHRGYWKDPSEKNLEVAFKRSFELGFGTETDIRDSLRDGKWVSVISHDPPRGGEITLEDILRLVKKYRTPQNPLPLALNIKADGQAEEVKRLLATYDIKDYYLFDMSMPDMIANTQAGLRCYTRLSEHEKFPPLLYDHKNVAGIWLDAYTGRWYDADFIRKLLRDGKDVAIVSPDLHKRMGEFQPLLDWLVETGLNREEKLAICTDRPEEALATVSKKASPPKP